jgi:UDP-2,3-diacylglucosamine pyrophosphatase LpxH
MSGKRKLQLEDIRYILYKTENQKDYITLNYFEREVVIQHGEDFITQSSGKIQYIMSFILNDRVENLYDMYEQCFNIYMMNCNHDIDKINGFNVVFTVLIHIALKIIRKNKKDILEE